jgi:hypothetical protein
VNAVGVLQDWIEVEGMGGDNVIQSGAKWLALEESQNLVFWLEVRGVALNPFLYYETAIATEPSVFRTMASIRLVSQSTPYVTRLPISINPDVPLGGLVRWRITSSDQIDERWKVTFRILYSAKPGKVNASNNPSSLPLTGWWPASYVGSPWVGQPSAGVSAGRDLSQALATAPTVGTALGIFTPASFNGTSARITSPLTTTSFFSASGYSIAALINSNSAVAPGAQPYLEPAILSDVGAGNMGMSFTSSGVRFFQYNGAAYNQVVVACSTAAWHLVQARHTASTIELRIDNGAWTSVGAGAPNFGVSQPLRVGTNWDASLFFNGSIAEVLTSNTVLTNNDFERVRAYVNGRYGLAL